MHYIKTPTALSTLSKMQPSPPSQPSTHTLGDLLDLIARVLYGPDGCKNGGWSSQTWSVTPDDRIYYRGFYHLLFEFWMLRVPEDPTFQDRNTPLGEIIKAMEEQQTNKLSLWLKLSKCGKTLQHLVTLHGVQNFQPQDSANVTEFSPRLVPEKQAPTPSFATDLDIDQRFPELSAWCFGVSSSHVEINLFQAGRKNIFAFLQRPRSGMVMGNELIVVPDKPDTISHYLHCLNEAVGFRTDKRDVCGTWSSIVAFPKRDWKRYEAFRKGSKGFDVGFNGMLLGVDDDSEEDWNEVFPKLAALAGHRKDKKIKRGWIRYKGGILMVCTGTGSPIAHPRAPKGTAFQGEGCHMPNDKDKVLFRFQVRLESLNDLFCRVEGLLATL